MNMLCMACEKRDAETDGLMCGACRAAVDAGLVGADAGAEVFNCVDEDSGGETADRARRLSDEATDREGPKKRRTGGE